jgi:phosphomevalonate kinase
LTRALVTVVAPGKMMLTGSYVVLRGAPALVCAVSRHAVARAPSGGRVSLEVAAAFDGEDAPDVDVSALRRAGQKLGLGSSAAAVVAALGYRAATRGEDPTSDAVRGAIFRAARAAHARVQGGGSGADIAASVHGGVLCYTLDEGGRPHVAPVALPASVHVDAYWSGRSARTSAMRARVDALETRAPELFDARMGDLSRAAHAAEAAVHAGEASAFIASVRASGRALAALGRDADAPIVPPEAGPLRLAAEEAGAAFTPSGAGGGDVFVHVGLAPPTAAFDVAARAVGFEPLELAIDALGVRVHPGLGEPLS